MKTDVWIIIGMPEDEDSGFIKYVETCGVFYSYEEAESRLISLEKATNRMQYKITSDII